MAKKILLKTLLPISVALIGGGIASSFVLTSCNKEYTGNLRGTDWDGYVSGFLEISTNPISKTATITSHNEYTANNLVMPKILKSGKKQYILQTIGASAFANCTGLTGVLTIPDSVIHLNGNAFNACTGLTELIMPSSIEDIGSDAFFGCSNLSGPLTIPDHVANIANDAFSGCTGLSGSLTLPNTVVNVGARAFNGCANFDNIKLINFSVINWTSNNIFLGWSNTGTVSLEGGTLTMDAALTKLHSLGLNEGWVAGSLA